MTILPDTSPATAASIASNARDSATPHPEFFVQDNEMVVVQAQNQLFRLPKYILVKSSPTFQKLLDNAKPTSSSTKESNLKLADVSAYEFETLCMEYHGQIDIKTATLERIAALLSICHRYDVIDIRRRLIPLIFSEASPLPPVEQLRLAELHDVTIANCVPALTILVARKQGLQEAELARLSHAMVAWLMEAREQFIRVTTEQHVRRNLGEVLQAASGADARNYLSQQTELARKIVMEVWGLSQSDVAEAISSV